MTGMHWGMDFGVLIALVIADFIAASGKYGDMKRNILAYMIYCIGPAGTYFVFYIDPQGWPKTMLKNGTTQDYIDTMSKAASASTLVIMVLGTFAVAALSGFIGSRLMKKQFEKSGECGGGQWCPQSVRGYKAAGTEQHGQCHRLYTDIRLLC